VQRVLREGRPEQQQALIKDELGRYARKLHGYIRGPRRSLEIFGIHFPSELRPLILSTGVNDPDPQPNGFYSAVTLEHGKTFLAILDETAKNGEGALRALVNRRDLAARGNTCEPPEIAIET
jgi:hypothetical protein